ncbi:glycoside hydrolase family 31 protein, partial [Alistipes onderdonkii]
ERAPNCVQRTVSSGFGSPRNPPISCALSAALRVHSTKDARLDRRPWISGERETAAMRRMYHMRSELMPYIYSSVWQTHSSMVSLNRPMYIDYGSDERAYENEQEFLFGICQ